MGETPKTRDELVDFMSVSGHPIDVNRAAYTLERITAAGLAIVPVEATEKMADVGESVLVCGPEPRDEEESPSATWAAAKGCYRRMIQAGRIDK